MELIDKNKKEFLKNISLIIILLLITAVYLYFFIYFERNIIGIENNYHPDSKYYYETYKNTAYLSIENSFFKNFQKLFINFFSNNFYSSIINIIFEVSEIINSTSIKLFGYISLEFLQDSFYRNIIKFNMLFYAIGNFLIITSYLKVFKQHRFDIKNLFILIIIIFLPYKTHLYSNILKDGLILFALIFYLTRRNVYVLSICTLFGIPMRWGFTLYLLLFLNKIIFNKKNIFFASSILILVSIYLFFEIIYNNEGIFSSLETFLRTRSTISMGDGRLFDKVPNFDQYIYGGLIRGIIWPVLFFSGSFVIFTDSYFFYILMSEIIILQTLIFLFYRRSIININLIIIIFIISVYCTTFTSFFRYAYVAFYISVLLTFLDFKIVKSYENVK